MKEKGAGQEIPPQPDVAQVVDFAPGMTLEEYVLYRQSLGRPVLPVSGGTHAWIPAERGVMERVPMEYTTPPDRAEVRQALRLKGCWFVNYLLEPDRTHPANCFDYVCGDTSYDITGLSSKARRDVRRGLRHFQVRLCTWEELTTKGFPARAETLARHGDAVTVSGIEVPKDRVAASRLIDVWGAWDGEDLVAWMRIFRIDDWALIAGTASRTQALKGCPNNAILYRATHHYLAVNRLRYVTYGLSFVQVGAAYVAMHKYKTRMGYEAVPRCRMFEMRTLLRPLLGTRVGSWALERAAGLIPAYAVLRKAAGLSRLLSGREKDPLRWADE